MHTPVGRGYTDRSVRLLRAERRLVLARIHYLLQLLHLLAKKLQIYFVLVLALKRIEVDHLLPSRAQPSGVLNAGICEW